MENSGNANRMEEDVLAVRGIEDIETKIEEYRRALQELDHSVTSTSTAGAMSTKGDEEMTWYQKSPHREEDGHETTWPGTSQFSDKEIERRLEDVQLALESLPSMMEHTTHLSSELNKTGNEAGKAISRIKVLDAIQRNAKLTLSRIDDILELQRCTTQVKTAVREGDISTAAENIRSFRKIESRLPIDEQEKEEMRDYEKQIISAIMSNMEEASYFMKAEEVTDCCRRLAQLGCANFGWQKLANFLRVQLFGEFKEILARFAASESTPYQAKSTGNFDIAALLDMVELIDVSDMQSFLDLISNLFGSSVDTLEGGIDIVRSAQYEEMQNQHSGTSPLQPSDTVQAAKFILESLHELTSKVTAKVIDRLQNAERIKALHRLSKLENSSSFEGDGLDMYKQESVDVVMDEVALTLQRSMSYFRAFNGEAKDWDDVAAENGTNFLSVQSSIEQNRDLLQTVGALSSLYTHFEQAAVQRGIAKAIIYDEMVELEPATSSLAEDAMFVLQKTARRAIATGNVDAVCAALHFISDNLTESSPAPLSDDARYCLDKIFPEENVSNWQNLHTLRSILEHYAQEDLNDGSGRNRLRSSGRTQQKSHANENDGGKNYSNPAVQKVLQEFEEFRQYQKEQIKKEGKKNTQNIQKFGEKLITGDFWESRASSTPTKQQSRNSAREMSPATHSFAQRSPSKADGSDYVLEDSEETVFGGLSPGIIASSCVINGFSSCRQMTETLNSTLMIELQETFPDELEELASQEEDKGSKGNKDAVKLGIAIEQIESSLQGVSDALTEVISRLCALLTPRLRGAMTVMEGKHSLLQYDFTEENARLNYDVFSNEFLTALDRIMSGFLRTLDEDSRHLFVLRIASYVSKQIESHMLRKRFSYIGALAFDEDVRKLSDFFTSRGGRSVKERLTRLIQMSQILCYERPSEIEELFRNADNNLFSWEFTSSEVKQILGLRVEYSSDDIEALQL